MRNGVKQTLPPPHKSGASATHQPKCRRLPLLLVRAGRRARALERCGGRLVRGKRVAAALSLGALLQRLRLCERESVCACVSLSELDSAMP